MPAAFAGLVAVAFTNANYVIVAMRFSATTAGLYWRGFQLGVAYQEKISGIMMRVAFPVYSRTGDRDSLRDLHRRATRLHATALFPLLAIVVVTAPVLVPFLFGPAWEGAVLPAQLLAFAGMMAAVLTGYPQVMLAIGQPEDAAALQLRDARRVRGGDPGRGAVRPERGVPVGGRRLRRDGAGGVRAAAETRNRR